MILIRERSSDISISGMLFAVVRVGGDERRTSPSRLTGDEHCKFYGRFRVFLTEIDKMSWENRAYRGIKNTKIAQKIRCVLWKNILETSTRFLIFFMPNKVNLKEYFIEQLAKKFFFLNNLIGRESCPHPLFGKLANLLLSYVSVALSGSQFSRFWEIRLLVTT